MFVCGSHNGRAACWCWWWWRRLAIVTLPVVSLPLVWRSETLLPLMYLCTALKHYHLLVMCLFVCRMCVCCVTQIVFCVVSQIVSEAAD